MRKKYKTKSLENAVCKNAIFVEEKLKDIAVKTIVNKGCNNLRANGSSHCSECSNKYNGKKN